MSDLDALIERIEAATRSDRLLDWRIAETVGHPSFGVTSSIWPPFQVGSKADKAIPRYTENVDAAMTLGDIGQIARQKQCIGEPDKWIAVHEPVRASGMSLSGRAATPALACCVVALKARARKAQP